jgi:hypothetical protein
MRTPIRQGTLIFAIFVALLPSLAYAHQPRITEARRTVISDPEVSKAYYGKLSGQPDVYVIDARAPFELYVNVLVPAIAGQKKDVSATIIKNGDAAHPLAKLDGLHATWKEFYEPFGADTYWMGPEYRAHAELGTYEIRVWSSHNDSKYSLAVGETEAFGFREGLNALALIPEIKRNFFNESPITFIRSPLGWGFIGIMYILAGIVGFIYRAILRRVARSGPRGISKNIGVTDRLIRLVLCVALLLMAITTTWNPILIFLSGFCLFEAVFSWCGLYAALGRNTCPINS